MTKLLILLGVVVACQGANLVYHPAWWGSSSAYQSKDSIGNYAFGYHDGHPGGPSFHSEAGDPSGRKVGSYGVHGADGKVRVVEYVADHGGFRANIKTSGEVDKTAGSPAAVTLTEVKPHHVPVAPYYGYPYGGVHYASPYYIAK